MSHNLISWQFFFFFFVALKSNHLTPKIQFNLRFIAYFFPSVSGVTTDMYNLVQQQKNNFKTVWSDPQDFYNRSQNSNKVRLPRKSIKKHKCRR